jgi:mannose-6-phosphate isomerase-like protein (cupin superfamily)
LKFRYFLATCLASMVAQAQQAPMPAMPAATPAEQNSISALEIAARIHQAEAVAKSGAPYHGAPLLLSGPYKANLEYHDRPADSFYVHENDSELFVVVEGSGTMTLGGKLINPTRKDANLMAPTEEGGVAHKLVKGDMLLIPENTVHAVTQVDGRLVLMSMHLPHVAVVP